jgi:hypothetical protein
MNSTIEIGVDQPASATGESPMLTAVKDYLDDLGWTYDIAERDEGERLRITTKVHLDPVLCKTCFEIHETRQRFGIFAYAPFMVSEEKRAAVMEYLTRANYRLFLAKFEFDLDDGELRVVSTAIPEDSVLSVEMIRRMRQDVHSVMEHYLPGVLAILYGNRTPNEAWQALKASEAAEVALTEAESE